MFGCFGWWFVVGRLVLCLDLLVVVCCLWQCLGCLILLM